MAWAYAIYSVGGLRRSPEVWTATADVVTEQYAPKRPRSWFKVVVDNPDTGQRLMSSTRDRLPSAVRAADQWSQQCIGVATVTELPSGRVIHVADPYGLADVDL